MTFLEQAQLLLARLQCTEMVLAGRGASSHLVEVLRNALHALRVGIDTQAVTSELLEAGGNAHHQVESWYALQPHYTLRSHSVHQITKLRCRLFDALDRVPQISAAPLELCVAIGSVIQESTGILAREVTTAVEIAVWLAEANEILKRAAHYETVELEVA